VKTLLEDLDQPTAALGATINDMDWEGTGTLEFSRAWDWLETHGKLDATTATRGELYIMTNSIRDLVVETFKGQKAKESKGPTVLQVGDKSIARHHWSFSLGRSEPPMKALRNTGACVLSIDLVTQSVTSATFITQMATQIARLMTVAISSVADVTVRSVCEPIKDTILRVMFVFDVTRSTGTTRAVGELVDTLSQSVNSFSLRCGWAASLAKLFDEPISALLASDVAVTLDTLPISTDFFSELAQQLAPDEEMGWKTINDVYKDIPGLRAFLGGDFQAELDLTTVAEKWLDNMMSDMDGTEGTATTGGSFISAIAPLIMIMCFDADSSVPVNMQVEGARASAELMRLSLARDIAEIRGVELRARNGFGVRLEFENTVCIDSIFGALDAALETVQDEAIKLETAEDDEDEE
jgi:hypothetical protein